MSETLPMVVRTVDEKNIACTELHFFTYGNGSLSSAISDKPSFTAACAAWKTTTTFFGAIKIDKYLSRPHPLMLLLHATQIYNIFSANNNVEYSNQMAKNPQRVALAQIGWKKR